jgi:hypothetical protein
LAGNKISHGPGDEIGDQYPNGKFAGKHQHNARHLCTQYFSDADSPGSSFGHKRGQPKKSLTGDENSQSREIAKDFSDLAFGLVKIINRFIQKSVLKWMSRYEFFPFLLFSAECRAQKEPFKNSTPGSLRYAPCALQ